MIVQLIVVRGKPEGLVIPLARPTFRIGRGEHCQLRPNSDLVSRDHAEFSITRDKVVLLDLGSRNGTLVNDRALTGPCILKDRDLIEVGSLTFAISIQGATLPESRRAPAPVRAEKAPQADPSQDDIDAWLVADNASPTPDRPSAVYDGET